MIYNLELFGKHIKEIRESLELSQKEVAKATNIDDSTIRRIESGKVLPKLDTLEILSPIYKKDLVHLLLQYRFDDYSVFYETKNKIELKLENGEQNRLSGEYELLNILLSATKNPYCKNLIRQFILFLDAIILYKDNNNNIALSKLIKAIKITTPSFDLDNYNLFVYSSMEIRILMNIAFILNKLNFDNKYIEIMEFCINSVCIDDEIYPKLCHNLSCAYIRNKDFQKALDFSNMGIKSCQENRNFNGLSILCYGKGVAEYRLNKEEYIQSFEISIYLCKAYGQTSLEKTIIDNCKKFLEIDL